MPEADSSRTFLGVRFLLAGFDPATETKVRSKLLEGGGTEAWGYDQSYTHLIVDKIAYDNPVCVAARENGKTLVTGLWVHHSFEVEAQVDATSILYRPLKDMNGVPGAKHLIMCLTGYQRQDRDDIMAMVGLMGAQFSKPLVANKVTHLICYKFEGEKYELANKLKRIKLVNHQWLEDCLRDWKLLPEENYSKSGYELEMMESEAKDSDEDAKETNTKQLSPCATERLQNSKDGTKDSGSSEKEDQALCIDRLSAGEVSISHKADTSLKSASVLLPDLQERTPQSIEIANDSKAFLGSAKKASQPDMNISASSTGKTPQSIEIANDSKAFLGSAKKASQPDMKISASSTGKTPQRSQNLIFSPEPSRAKFSPNLHLDDSMHVTNMENIEHVKDLFASGRERSRQKEASELLFTETSNDKKRKMEASSSTSLLEKTSLTATPSASGFNSSVLVSHLPRSNKLPRLNSGLAGDMLEKEKADEINKIGLLDELKTSESGGKSGCDIVGMTEANEMGEPEELQERNHVEGTTSRCSVKSGRKLSRTYANSDKDGKENAKVVQPLKNKTAATKTLGSRPKLNTPVNQKGSIYLNKIGGGDDPTISPDVEYEGSGFCGLSCSGELENSHATINIASRDGTVVRARCADDEIEKPKDREECGTVLIEKSFKSSCTAAKKVLRDPQLDADVLKEDVEEGLRADLITIETNKPDESTPEANGYKPEPGKDDHGQSSGETVLKAIEIPQDINGKAGGKKRGKPSNAGKTKNKPSSRQKSRDFKQVEKENHPLVDGDENQSPIGENLGKKAIVSNETLEDISLKDKKSAKSPAPTSDVPNEAKNQPACFILTGHRLQRKEFRQLIKRLRGKCCRDFHQWSYQATHYISPDPIRRTEKFFAAAASGRWILKTDYLTACNEAGKFLPEEPFEWHKNGLNEDGAINLEAPRKWRLLRAQTGHGAFYGMRIVIYGECIAPPLDTLKRVLKAGDGTILATSPPYTRFLTSGVDYAVISPGMPRVNMWVQEFLKHEIPCVVADYLVEYVCKPEYPLERHVLYGSHALAEKSLANLLRRAEEVTSN